jgi:hypothetical protein
MGSWLRHACTSVGVAAHREDLWLPGALAWLVYLGWLPLVVTVVPLPDDGDLAFLAARLVPTAGIPLALILLALALTAGCVLLGLAGAAAEVALQRGLAGGGPDGAGDGGWARSALTAFTIFLVASAPVALVAFGLGSGIAAIAPVEYQSADVDTPVLLRVVLAALPWEVALVAALIVGQAIGAAALQRALPPGGTPIGAALGAGVRDLARQPARRLGSALTMTLADAVVLVISLSLLGVLWAPIRSDLEAGRLGNPASVLLLVGFVAIWLALLLASGALHAAGSAWWRLELRGSLRERTEGPSRLPQGGATTR